MAQGLSSDLKRIRTKLSSWQPLFVWYRHYKLLFFFSFLVVLGFGGFAWYQDLYGYSWNDTEKRAFLDTYSKETSFKEAKYRDAVDRLKQRMEWHQTPPVITKDIFTGKELSEDR